MNPIYVFLFSFLSTVALIRVAMPLGVRTGLVDVPGGRRKHTAPVPLVGGVSMYVALLATGLIVWCFDWTPMPAGLLAGCSLLVLVGVLDDRYALSVRSRFIVQITAALVMAIPSGVTLMHLGDLLPGVGFYLGYFAIPLTVIAGVAVINATNMMDGVDGLAGSLSLSCMLLMATAALVAGFQEDYSVLLIFSGLLAGFLVYNFRFGKTTKAQVFMGDAGSMFLGFVLVWYLVSLSQAGHQAFAPITAVWIFAVPLFDTAAVILRRMRYGNSPFKADRTHIHHFLMDGGLSVRNTVLLMVTGQITMGLIGLAGFYWGVADFVMLMAFIGVFAIYFTSIVRSWRFVTMLQCWRQILKSTARHPSKIFIGNLPSDQTSEEVQRLLSDQLASIAGYRVYKRISDDGRELGHCILDHNGNIDALIRHMRKQLSVDSRIVVRPLYIRNPATDQRRERKESWEGGVDRRANDRRADHHELVEHVNGEWLSLLERLKAYGTELKKSLDEQAQDRQENTQACHQKLVTLNQNLGKIEALLKEKRVAREKSVAILASSKRSIALYETALTQLRRDELIQDEQTIGQALMHWQKRQTSLEAEQGRLDSCRSELKDRLARLTLLQNKSEKASQYRDNTEIAGGIQALETEYEQLMDTLNNNQAQALQAGLSLKRLQDFADCYEQDAGAASKRYAQVEKVANTLGQHIQELEQKRLILQQQKRKIELNAIEGALGETSMKVERDGIRFFAEEGRVDTSGLTLEQLREHYQKAHEAYEQQCLDFAAGEEAQAGTAVVDVPCDDRLLISSQNLQVLESNLSDVGLKHEHLLHGLDAMESQLSELVRKGESLLNIRS